MLLTLSELEVMLTFKGYKNKMFECCNFLPNKAQCPWEAEKKVISAIQ